MDCFASCINLGAGNGIRTRDIQLGRLTLYQLSYSRLGSLFHGGGWIRTNEGESRQIYSLLPLATWVPLRALSFVLVVRSSWFLCCSSRGRRRDSNPRPTDYKSVALPTELHRQAPDLTALLLSSATGFKYRDNCFDNQWDPQQPLPTRAYTSRRSAGVARCTPATPGPSRPRPPPPFHLSGAHVGAVLGPLTLKQPNQPTPPRHAAQEPLGQLAPLPKKASRATTRKRPSVGNFRRGCQACPLPTAPLLTR
jgi:hypothetical protein